MLGQGGDRQAQTVSGCVMSVREGGGRMAYLEMVGEGSGVLKCCVALVAEHGHLQQGLEPHARTQEHKTAMAIREREAQQWDRSLPLPSAPAADRGIHPQLADGRFYWPNWNVK